MDGRRMIGGVCSGFANLGLSIVAVLNGIQMFGLDPTGRMARRLMAPLNNISSQFGASIAAPRTSNVSDVLLNRWEAPILAVAVVMLAIALFAEGFGPVLYRLGRTASLLTFLGLLAYSAPQVLAELTSTPQTTWYPAALETRLSVAFAGSMALWLLGYLLRPDYKHT